jgi:hypothetical protein
MFLMFYILYYILYACIVGTIYAFIGVFWLGWLILKGIYHLVTPRS